MDPFPSLRMRKFLHCSTVQLLGTVLRYSILKSHPTIMVRLCGAALSHCVSFSSLLSLRGSPPLLYPPTISRWLRPRVRGNVNIRQITGRTSAERSELIAVPWRCSTCTLGNSDSQQVCLRAWVSSVCSQAEA